MKQSKTWIRVMAVLSFLLIFWESYQILLDLTNELMFYFVIDFICLLWTIYSFVFYLILAVTKKQVTTEVFKKLYYIAIGLFFCNIIVGIFAYITLSKVNGAVEVREESSSTYKEEPIHFSTSSVYDVIENVIKSTSTEEEKYKKLNEFLKNGIISMEEYEHIKETIIKDEIES